jgi:hypothetical protein
LIEELHELHDLIEPGPTWFAIAKIEIRLTSPIAGVTLANAEQKLR